MTGRVADHVPGTAAFRRRSTDRARRGSRTGRAAVEVGLGVLGVLLAVRCSAAAPTPEAPPVPAAASSADGPPSGADETGAAVAMALATPAPSTDGRDPIVDEDYRFRLDWPGSGWQLLDEEHASVLAPAAIAGAGHEAGIYGFLVVEATAEQDVVRFAEASYELLAMEGKQLGTVEPLEFHGIPAVRFLATGTLNGLFLQLVRIIWLSGGYAFQATAFGVPDEIGPAGDGAQPFFDALSPLPGEIRARATTRVAPDRIGVGWRVVAGRFESAVHRLVLTPPEGWVVVVDEELRRLNRSAAVGLKRARPEMYLVLIVEQIDPSQQEILQGELLARLAESLGTELTDERTVRRVDGREVSFVRVRGTRPAGVESHYGFLIEGRTCIQVLASYSSGQADDPAAEIDGALAGIRLLDAAATAELARELEAVPDPQNRVGPDFALRRGVYRDFRHSFEWRKPPGFWRILVGEAAREVNPSAGVFLEDPASGLFGMLIAESARSFDGPSYHATVLANLVGQTPDRPAAEPTELVLGAARGLLTETRMALGGLVFDYWVATSVFRTAAVQLMVWGAPAAMEAARSEADEVLAGLRFTPARLQSVTTADGVYRDHRLGFAVRVPESDWTLEDRTPPTITSVGTVLQWRREGLGLAVSATCTGREEFDAQRVRERLERSALGNLLDGESPGGGWQETTFQGQPAWTADVAADSSFVRILVVDRDRTVFAVTAEVQAGADRTALDALLERFSLLE